MFPTNIVELPEHIRNNGELLAKLQLFGNHMRMHYSAPVYLCGSALAPQNVRPKDYDVTIWIPDEEFQVRYKESAAEWEMSHNTGQFFEEHWRWCDDMTKQWRFGWGEVGLHIDFKVYPLSVASAPHNYGNKPHARIDTHPDEE